MKQYIIAVVEGTRFDLAPKFSGTYGKVYNYGRFNLIIWTGGDWGNEYEKAYAEIAAYVAKVNAEMKGNKYYNGWVRAEMLTPNEQGQYNDHFCSVFHSWLVEKMITSDEIIVSKVNACSKNLNDRIETYSNIGEVAKIARAVSGEMLQAIHLPGSFIHNCHMSAKENKFLPNQPIFELGWTLPYSIQIIDQSYSSCFKVEKKDE